MDFVPASDEEDISFPAPVKLPKSNPLEDPYSFEALVAAVPRRGTRQAANKPTTTARSPSGAHSTCQGVESISEFTEEQPAMHCRSQTIPPTSSIAEFSTTPPAQSTSKTRKHLTSRSSLTPLGLTHGGRHNTNLDEFQPPPFPIIDISDDSDYDGDPRATKQNKKTRKPADRNALKSRAPQKSKSTNQAEAETMHQVKIGNEGGSLCESKRPPGKRKAPVETTADEPPKKKARKSPTNQPFEGDLALPSLLGSPALAPRVPLKDAPSFLDAANSHPKENAVEPSEDLVPHPPNKQAKKVIASCGEENSPEAELTVESKVTESRKKKGKSRKVLVVDSGVDTAEADANVVVPHSPLAPPYKLQPVIELPKRRSKKKVVQSSEDAGDEFGGSEDELLIQSTNMSGRAKVTSNNPASKGEKKGKKKAPHVKLTSGETLAAQAPDLDLFAEVPKQLGTSMDGARDVPQGEATSLLVPHDFALANSNPLLPPLRDTNKPSNKPPSANPSTVAAEPPTPEHKRPSIGHTIPKRKDSMTLILQRAGLHAPLSSSRLTVPATARIAPLHLRRKTPPPPPLPVPKPKKKVESEEETDKEEYEGLSERQITKLKEEKRKRAWYSP